MSMKKHSSCGSRRCPLSLLQTEEDSKKQEHGCSSGTETDRYPGAAAVKRRQPAYITKDQPAADKAYQHSDDKRHPQRIEGDAKPGQHKEPDKRNDNKSHRRHLAIRDPVILADKRKQSKRGKTGQPRGKRVSEHIYNEPASYDALIRLQRKNERRSADEHPVEQSELQWLKRKTISKRDRHNSREQERENILGYK